MSTSDLSGRVAIVTGAGDGIGRASLLALVRNGASAVGCDVDEGRLQETLRLAEKIRPGAGRVRTADVSDPQQMAEVVALATSEFGGLDIVHANAGISQPVAAAGDIPLDTWRRVIEVNLTGLVVTFQTALPALRESAHASFIATASGLGVVGSPGLAAYVASKHAVVGFIKSAGLDYARSGVRINAVAPGMTETPMLMSSTSEEVRANMTAAIPAGRFGTPEDIAGAVVWLASDQSKYVVGATIVVDGGDSID